MKKNPSILNDAIRFGKLAGGFRDSWDLPFAFWFLLIEFEIELFDLLKTNRFSILKQKIYYDMI